MRCVVTGAAGFIGSHLAERLIADGHDVVGIDAFTPFYPRALKLANIRGLSAARRFGLVEADLASADLAPLLADAEWVFHLAAQAGVRSSWGGEFAAYTVCNITATQRLLEAAMHAPRLQRLVYASSSSVYGDAATLPVTEDAPARPLSPYGVTKLAAEHLCTLYAHSFGVPAVSLRYFSVYGPRQRPDMSFHRFGKALLQGSEIVVYGDGHQTRDFTYVGDVVEATVRAASTAGVEGEIFNIAGGAQASVRGVIATMETMSGRAARVRHEQTAHGDVRDTAADTSRARRMLGFVPMVALPEGIGAEWEYLETLYGAARSTVSRYNHTVLPASA
jgi:nucleoside-diphosphate-sugar epimerase